MKRQPNGSIDSILGAFCVQQKEGKHGSLMRDLCLTMSSPYNVQCKLYDLVH